MEEGPVPGLDLHRKEILKKETVAPGPEEKVADKRHDQRKLEIQERGKKESSFDRSDRSRRRGSFNFTISCKYVKSSSIKASITYPRDWMREDSSKRNKIGKWQVTNVQPAFELSSFSSSMKLSRTPSFSLGSSIRNLSFSCPAYLLIFLTIKKRFSFPPRLLSRLNTSRQEF